MVPDVTLWMVGPVEKMMYHESKVCLGKQSAYTYKVLQV